MNFPVMTRPPPPSVPPATVSFNLTHYTPVWLGLAVVSVVVLVFTFFFVPETLPRKNKVPWSPCKVTTKTM